MSRSARHRILVVGAGSIGERHLRCFLQTGRAEVAFVETHPDVRQAVAGRYPQVRTFSDCDTAMGDYSAAVIATPAPSHVPLATRLANAGLHVLIEKPLSVSNDEVPALERAVAEANVVAAVAYVYRAHPALAGMRETIRAGDFGKPVELVAVCGQHFPLYRPAYRQTYYAHHATGGGAVQDALTHVLNAGEWLVGPTRRVVSDVGRLVLDGVDVEDDVEDTAHVLARHGDNGEVLASYSLNQHQAPNEITITVVCENGTARFEYHENRWRGMTDPGGKWHDHDAGVLERDALFIRQAEAFLDAVEGHAAPLCSLADGITTLRTNLAVLRSVESERWQACGTEAGAL